MSLLFANTFVYWSRPFLNWVKVSMIVHNPDQPSSACFISLNVDSRRGDSRMSLPDA